MLTTSHATGPSTPPVLDITIGDALRNSAQNVPDRPALIEGAPDPAARREWTYAELYAASERTARALLARFSPGDNISVWAHNVPEWVLLEFGCALAGMSIVTVNPALQAAEVRYILTQSDSVALFCVDEHRGNALLAIANEVHPDCPDLREIIRISQWDDFIAGAESFTGALPTVHPDDRVMIQYTSGTTGFPKGAELHHRGLLTNASHYFDRLGMGDGQVLVTMMPLFHTAGSAMSVLGATTTQCTQVLVPAFDPPLVLELIETYSGQRDDGCSHDDGGVDGGSRGEHGRSLFAHGAVLGRVARPRANGERASKTASGRPSPSCTARPSVRPW